MRDTITMAREVKATAYTNRHYPDRTTYTFTPEQLEALADLVRADERNRTWTQEHWTEYERSIAAQEREACAMLCDALHYEVDAYGAQCAAAIRARKETK